MITSAKIIVYVFVVLFSAANIAFAQSIPELDRNPDIKPEELDNISLLSMADSLKPVFWSEEVKYTTDPSASAIRMVYGCTGDFNNDGNTDYALVVNNTQIERDQLVVITAADTHFVLQSFTPLKEIVEKNPFSRMLGAPRCYKKSETGKFTGLEEMEYNMPGDLIRFGWYSWVWDGENGFKEIVTSD